MVIRRNQKLSRNVSGVLQYHTKIHKVIPMYLGVYTEEAILPCPEATSGLRHVVGIT